MSQRRYTPARNDSGESATARLLAKLERQHQDDLAYKRETGKFRRVRWERDSWDGRDQDEEESHG